MFRCFYGGVYFRTATRGDKRWKHQRHQWKQLLILKKKHFWSVAEIPIFKIIKHGQRFKGNKEVKNHSIEMQHGDQKRKISFQENFKVKRNIVQPRWKRKCRKEEEFWKILMFLEISVKGASCNLKIFLPMQFGGYQFISVWMEHLEYGRQIMLSYLKRHY